jgi:hypothetical protein
MATTNPLKSNLILPFTYLFPAIVIPALGQVQQNLQMASDSYFELLRYVGISSADNPTDYAPNNFSVQLTDQSTGKQMMSGQVPQAMAITRSYQFGNDEKYPIQFPAQTIVVGTFINLTNSQLTVTFGLKGYKIFQLSP